MCVWSGMEGDVLSPSLPFVCVCVIMFTLPFSLVLALAQDLISLFFRSYVVCHRV